MGPIKPIETFISFITPLLFIMGIPKLNNPPRVRLSAVKIHEQLDPHVGNSEYASKGIPNMHRVSASFKSNPHTAGYNTEHPCGSKKHRGMF